MRETRDRKQDTPEGDRRDDSAEVDRAQEGRDRTENVDVGVHVGSGTAPFLPLHCLDEAIEVSLQ